MGYKTKLNEVDNHYAITTADLAQGIMKAGAVAKTYGVDLDTLNGYVTAIGSTTRETGTIVGNSLKTIFSRITTMQPSIDALKNVGVSINDTKGQVKPVSDILENLAKKWGNLSAAQQQNLGIQLAGRWQLTRFLALMNNWDIATQATTTSINSQGSAMKEQSKYSDSLQARINRLDTAWGKFTLSMGKAFLTDTLITGIESLNGLATASAGVVNSIGVLPGLFGTIGVLVVALSGKFRAFTTAAMFGTNVLTEQQLALTGLTRGMRGAGVATTAFSVSLRSLAAATGVGLVLAGIGFAIEKLVSAYSDAKKADEDYRAQQQKGVDALTTNKDETVKLIGQYESLSAAKKKAGDSWGTQDEQKYLQVQNQLAYLYPQLINYVDGAGNSHLKSKAAIDQEIKATNALIDSQKRLTRDTATKDIQKQLSQMNDIQDQIKNKKLFPYNQEYYLHVGDIGLFPKLGNPFYDFSKEAKDKNDNNIQILQNKWSDAAQKINSEVLKISDAYTKLKIDPNLQQSVDDFVSSLDFSKIDGGSNKEKALTIENISKNIAEYTSQMQQALSKGNKGAYDSARTSLINYIDSIKGVDIKAASLPMTFNNVKAAIDRLAKSTYSGSDGMDQYAQDVQTVDDAIQQAKGDFPALANIIDQMAKSGNINGAITLAEGDAYSALSDKISPVNQLLEDMANGKKISASEAMNLIGKEQELSKYITIEGNSVKINTAGIKTWRNAQVSSYNDSLKAIQADANATANATISKLRSYGLEIQSIKDLASAKAALAQADQLYTFSQTDENGNINPKNSFLSKNETNQIKAAKGQIQTVVDAYKNIGQLSKLASAGLKQVGTSADTTSAKTDKAKKSTDSASKSVENSTYIADKYAQALSKVNYALDQQTAIQKRYSDYSTQYQKSLKTELSLLEQKKSILEAQAKALDKQIKSGNIQQTGVITTKSPSSGGNTTSSAIFGYLKSAGFSDSAAAGIMGNLKLESGYSTTIVNPTSGATGIAQWLGSRLTNLKSYAKSQGTSWTSLQTQLDFLLKEFNPMLKRNGGISNFNSLSSTQAAYLFEKLFERSGGQALGARESYANSIYKQFKGTSGSSSLGDASQAISDASKAKADMQAAIDDAKSKKLDIQSQILDLGDQIQQKVMDIVNSTLSKYDHLKSSLQDDYAAVDLAESKVADSSKQWAQLEEKRVALKEKEKGYDQQAISYIQSQIDHNKKLDAAQRDTLRSDIVQRKTDLINLEKDIADAQISLANKVLDTYKQILDQQKQAATDAIDKMLNAIDQEVNDNQYNKDLADKQKSVQDLQDQLNSLSMDASASAIKQRADLQQQLQQAQQDLQDTIDTHNIDLRKQNLNDQKDSITKYYDNLINDEVKLNSMRDNLVKGNTKSMQTQLSSFYKWVKDKTKDLGSAVSDNLLQLISQAQTIVTGETPKKKSIKKFAVGGYTSNSEGLAYLDKQEQVLNKDDTKNILDTVKAVNNLARKISIPNLSNLQLLSPAIAGTGGGTIYNINLRVDNLNGTKNDANFVLNEIVKGVKRMGGKI